MKTGHYNRVLKFMKLAGQDTPASPVLPSEDVRRLRARLILEECLETIKALGYHATVIPGQTVVLTINGCARSAADLVEVVDGCCDIKVVTTGTLIACGIPDKYVQQLVDENNLAKFGPGGYRDAGGKWIKPPGHMPPDIAGFLEQLRKETRVACT